jgi:phosphoserine phosphatase
MKIYYVPINDPEEKEDGTLGSQTVDVVTLQGTKKKRIKQWREYLRIRLKTQDVHKMNHMTRKLGFDELLP